MCDSSNKELKSITPTYPTLTQLQMAKCVFQVGDYKKLHDISSSSKLLQPPPLKNYGLFLIT